MPPRSISEEEMLERALQQWGVDRYKNNDHREFWDTCVDRVRDVLEGEHGPVATNDLQELPPDPLRAMEKVFYDEFRGVIENNGKEHVGDVVDRLGEVLPEFKQRSPFYWHRFERKYVYHKECKDLPMDLLDPLTRFRFVKVPKMELLKRRYVHEEAHIATAYRAIAAHGASTADCVNCNEATVRWNGYGPPEVQNRFWNKLVCATCESVYDLKAAASMDLVRRKLMEQQKVYGGSFFNQFHAVRNSMPKQAKSFVVMVSKDPVQTVTGLAWPVYVAEIKRVVPALKDRSFRLDDMDRIYATMHLKEDSAKRWFRVPHFVFDSSALASQVLERFVDN